jgi:ParB family chromosome partitioning protein
MREKLSNSPGIEREHKRVLGRGLSALIPSSARISSALTAPAEPVAAAPASAPTEAVETANGLRYISLTKIALNPFQPRADFSPQQLQELSDSIKQHGVLQPIVVRPKGKTTYELIAGERRFRAATNAGLTEIPAVVKDMDDRSSLAIALIENIQRQELNPIESARAYQRLLTEFRLTQSELALEVGKSQPSIANSLRLLQLPEEILVSVSSGKISEGHAKVILSVDSEEDKIALWQTVLKGGLTVRETERRAAAIRTPPIPRGITPVVVESDTIDHASMEEVLSLALGTKVRVRLFGEAKGQIEIEFYDLDHLDGIILKLSPD